MDLFLSNTTSSLFLRLLSHYTRFTSQPSCQIVTLNENTFKFAENNPSLMKLPTLPCLVTETALMTSEYVIASKIVEKTFTSAILLGDNELQNA